MLKILIHEWVTGGGLAGSAPPDSWAVEGHAMRRAIVRDFAALDGVAVVSTLDARFRPDDTAGEVVPVGPGEEESILDRLARACDFTLLIAPETGGLLADRARRVEIAGGRTLGSTPEAVELATDKLRLSRHLIGRGIGTPPTEMFMPGRGLPRDFPYPAVAKPIDGAGSLHTFLCRDEDDPPIGDLPPAMVLQPYIPGTPLSATFLVGPSGAVRLVGVGRQNLAIVDGIFRYRGGSLPEPAARALGGPLDAVRSVAGLRGWVGVDFVLDATTGEATVIEINPRPTTSYVGLSALLPAGAIARAWLDLFSKPGIRDDLAGMIDAEGSRRLRFFPDGSISREADEA